MSDMQRTDLTVYEQAQGFQKMLDLGDTQEALMAVLKARIKRVKEGEQ